MTTHGLKTKPILHHGICPSCGEETPFDLLGIQAWPEAVAKITGLPAIQTVWQCRNCDTTLMEPSLNLNQSS
ncbi:MAG: hypothetical protein WBC91_11510 [Phototrophicaceae bacterium]